MLIQPAKIIELLEKYKIKINGVFHIGAHDCEELYFYERFLKINRDNVYWIEAIEKKVEQAKIRGIPNIYNLLITDSDNDNIDFNISNNVQSSSILELGMHMSEHPDIHYISKVNMKTQTIDTFFNINNINNIILNFWNLDIQGAELLALKGGINSLRHVDVLYLEVNEKELYSKCALINELDSFLLENNFQRMITQMTKHGWGDAIYISKKYIPQFSENKFKLFDNPTNLNQTSLQLQFKNVRNINLSKMNFL
tara:strand:+ start:2240 stop:3001 length:762 start_codon:yes stop_codon:yes gene_type:complete